jgi:hypothetical protein
VLKDNSGHAIRLKYLSSNKTVELYGRLHADLFNSNKMLINDLGLSGYRARRRMEDIRGPVLVAGVSQNK